MNSKRYQLKLEPRKLLELLKEAGHCSEEVEQFIQAAEQTSLCVDPKNSCWEFRFAVNGKRHPSDLDNCLKTVCKNRVDGLNEISVLTLPCGEPGGSLDAWLEENWEALKSNILELSPVLRSALEYARPSLVDGELKIELAYPNWIQVCEDRQVDEYVKNWVSERWGNCPPVDFVLGDFEGEIESDARRIEDQEQERIKKQRQRSQLRAQKEKETVLRGRRIKTEAIEVKEINGELNSATIQGQVVEAEFVRTAKKKKNFVKGIISDRTASLPFMIFMDDKKENLIGLEDSWLKIRGRVQKDNYRSGQDYLMFVNDVNKIPPMIREDRMPVKRAELHCHTNMSQLDALTDVEELIERVAFWDQPAVAISDHGVVHSFPDAAAAAEKYGVKVIYGMEGYLVNDKRPLVLNGAASSAADSPLKEEFIALDCETTGPSPWISEVFQVAAVRVQGGEIKERYETSVAVDQVPEKLLNNSRLSRDDLLEAPPAEEVANQLENFVGGLPLVVYEASFVRNFLDKMGYCPTGPVVHLRRLVERFWSPGESGLNKVFASRFREDVEHQFDASSDVRRTLQILEELQPKLPSPATPAAIKKLEKDSDHRDPFYHVLILARTQKGLENLYRLVSRSHVEHFYKQPRILRSELEEMREGLLIGSACEQGEIYQCVIQGEPDEKVKERIKFYDFIELQPVDNNRFMLEVGDSYDSITSREDIRDLNRRLYRLGDEVGKPVVGTSDAHFLDPEDEKFRSVLQAGQEFSDADNQPPVYLRTTEEMIAEFDYLGEDEAIEVAVDNPRLVSGWCEELKPVPEDFYPPRVDEARDEFLQTTDGRAREIYGEELPDLVEKRLEKERQAILDNKFENLYVVSAWLVKKSHRDGYLVGSRGSVGSSFAAYLMDITEVNPLPPHYRCPACDYVDFPDDYGDIVGVDLPPEDCPACEEELARDGYNIPFEVFCGFEGDKVPDIDLNFSGDYQEEMFNYVEEIFGKENIFRAGTITTVSNRTAAGFVGKYMEERNIWGKMAEKKRLMKGVQGIKQNTSQHPGGMIIVPEDHSIYEFTPINYPANDRDADFLTTHFDYHAMEDQLVKLDILGHDNPTQLRHLEELTGVDPVGVPLDDPATLELFSSLDSLDLEPQELGMEVGVLGVPEFGTTFVRDMVEETRPSTFADLIRISGLSHGEDVWLNNARQLVKSGKVDLTAVITCRDDIMNELIRHGLPESIAFQIMEDVRKGRGLNEDQVQKMKACGVPKWYIKSCQKIQYLFPKAHAAAYVTMAFRIAYYKVHHPAAFYTSFLSLKADYVDAAHITSLAKVDDRLDELEAIIEHKKSQNQTTSRDAAELSALEVLREGYLRGVQVKPPRLTASEGLRFSLEEENTIRAPYVSIPGLGGTVAEGIAREIKNKNFSSVEDVTNRTQINTTVAENARSLGFFEGLPETENISLFA